MKDFEEDFQANVKKAESLLNKFISLKILTILILIVVVFIIMYGEILTAVVMLMLYFYQLALINKFKDQVTQFKLEKSKRIEKKKKQAKKTTKKTTKKNVKKK